MKWFKGLKPHWKIVVVLAIAGGIAYVARDPRAAGHKVAELGPVIGKIAEGLGDFFSGLVS